MASSTLSRREMMKMSAGILLAAGLWPSRAHAAEPDSKPFKFIQINDLHYSDKNCDPFFEGLVKQLNAVRDAAFVLIAGDLVDNGTDAQCKAMRDLLAGLKIPYHVSPGNHDPAAYNDRAPFEAAFGKEFNTTFEVQGWQFVGLDTTDGINVSGFDCHKETLDFVASLPGKLDKAKPTVIYTHVPLGPGVNMRLKNADSLLEPFKQLNVRAILSGHYHGFKEKKMLDGAIATTDACCSFKRTNHDNKFEKGFFVIEAAEGKVKRTFMDYGATPNKKPLPTTRPAVTDPSRPSF
jgi:predicted MPP superfamily phosphohydrolase